MLAAYRERRNYSEYINSCRPMNRINPAQSNSHREDRPCDGEWNQSDRSLQEPAVTDIVPMTIWSRAILSAEG